MYKIYINESPLILCKTDHPILKKLNGDHVLKVRYRHQAKMLFPYIDLLEKSTEPKSVIIYADDPKLLWKDFKSIFVAVRASGGVTVNSKGQILAIFRKGFWDLPKGKIEVGEKKRAAGIREVQEETGIKDVVITEKLTKTYHAFRVKGGRALKITHWYIMNSDDVDLTPQKKEGIDKVRWMKLADWFKLNEPTFKNILEVLEKYKRRIHKKRESLA